MLKGMVNRINEAEVGINFIHYFSILIVKMMFLLFFHRIE